MATPTHHRRTNAPTSKDPKTIFEEIAALDETASGAAAVTHIEADHGTKGLLFGLIRLARPKQWAKNVLVFAAPGAAGVMTQVDSIVPALLAFAAFCLAASGTYYLNDARDVEADRRHPRKRNRPIAAGIVPIMTANVVGGILLAASVVLGAAAVNVELALVLAVYVSMTIAYSTVLKHQPVIEMAAVSSGFVLRTIAGAVAVDVPVSNWFLIVASFGSLLLVAGKRLGEYMELGGSGAVTRRVLTEYTETFLRQVTTLALGVVVVAYCLWAFEKASLSEGAVWFELSVVPFVLAILRYAQVVDAGDGGDPEEVVLGDATLRWLGVLWLLTFVPAVYGV